MKKIWVILISLLSLYSCNKDDESVDNSKKECWTFTLKQVTRINPSLSGYPQTITTKTEQCNLTEKEAEEVAAKLSTKITSSSGKYTVTVTVTVTKQRTSEINPIVGERVPI